MAKVFDGARAGGGGMLGRVGIDRRVWFYVQRGDGRGGTQAVEPLETAAPELAAAAATVEPLDRPHP